MDLNLEKNFNNVEKNNIKEQLFRSFSGNFGLVFSEVDNTAYQVSFEAKEEISSEKINHFLEDFFTKNGFSIKKNEAGYVFRKGKEMLLVSFTNFSGKRPFEIVLSAKTHSFS